MSIIGLTQKRLSFQHHRDPNLNGKQAPSQQHQHRGMLQLFRLAHEEAGAHVLGLGPSMDYCKAGMEHSPFKMRERFSKIWNMPNNSIERLPVSFESRRRRGRHQLAPADPSPSPTPPDSMYIH